MDEEKFKKFATGKMKLTIMKEDFEIDPTVEERLPVMQYLVTMAKAAENEKFVKPELAAQIKETLIKVFKRNYPSVDDKYIAEFVDKAFELIITEIALASGWLSKEALQKQVDKATGKKKT